MTNTYDKDSEGFDRPDVTQKIPYEPIAEVARRWRVEQVMRELSAEGDAS